LECQHRAVRREPHERCVGGHLTRARFGYAGFGAPAYGDRAARRPEAEATAVPHRDPVLGLAGPPCDHRARPETEATQRVCLTAPRFGNRHARACLESAHASSAPTYDHCTTSGSPPSRCASTGIATRVARSWSATS